MDFERRAECGGRGHRRLGWVLAAREAQARNAEADLRGAVALVTGGSRGLGLALSRELAQQGCRLAICARDEIRAGGGASRPGAAERCAEVLAVPCDVADPTQVAAMVETVTRHYGRIDILINNAGIMVVAPVETLTRADFERVMAVNFWGVLNPTLEVLPGMRTRGAGRIVNITSIGGKIAVPHLLPYSCAKFAAVGFSEGLRAELADTGISVTTVVPGLMRTGSHLNAEFGGEQEAEYRWFALGASAPYPVAIGADRAARLIVRAAKRGAGRVHLSALSGGRRPAQRPPPECDDERAGAGRPILAAAAAASGGDEARSRRRGRYRVAGTARGDGPGPGRGRRVQAGPVRRRSIIGRTSQHDVMDSGDLVRAASVDRRNIRRNY